MDESGERETASMGSSPTESGKFCIRQLHQSLPQNNQVKHLYKLGEGLCGSGRGKRQC